MFELQKCVDVLRRLNGNNLAGTIPPSLGKLTNLEKLELQKNALGGSIPSSLGNIKTLQFLYVLAPKFIKRKLANTILSFLKVARKNYAVSTSAIISFRRHQPVI